MENFGNFLFRHGSILVDALEELSIFAVLHEDVHLVVFADHLVDLGDVLMHQVLLELDLPLDALQLLGLVLLHCGDLHCHCLARKPMQSFLDFAETSLTDGFSCVVKRVLSS